MSKSSSTEIIAVLWLIAGLLCHNWLHWVFYALAIENTVESMYNAWKDRPTLPTLPTAETETTG